MKLSALIRELVRAEGASESAGSKDVIIDLGSGPPYPDVTGLGEPNEDTVVLTAKVIEE